MLHRDLKPQNILVNSSCELAIADLGLARFVGTEADDADEAESLALTAYVVTRWYRAPELLCACPHYDGAVDVWSAGLILAEMLGRRPLLPGRSFTDQLKLTLAVLGTPCTDDTAFIANEVALATVRAAPHRAKIDWRARFPAAPAPALDLLSKMLQFDPAKRITVEAALKHSYVSDYALAADEPLAKRIDPAEFAFDKLKLSREDIAREMLAEVARLCPAAERLAPRSARMAALAAKTKEAADAAALAAKSKEAADAAALAAKAKEAADAVKAKVAAESTVLAAKAEVPAKVVDPSVAAPARAAPSAPSTSAKPAVPSTREVAPAPSHAASAPVRVPVQASVQAPVQAPVQAHVQAPTLASAQALSRVPGNVPAPAILPAPARLEASSAPVAKPVAAPMPIRAASQVPAPVPDASSGLVSALISQMQILRTDLLATVDARLAAVLARVEALEKLANTAGAKPPSGAKPT